MEAKTWALGEILKPERRYIIRTFQRSYEWTEGKQWRRLFADHGSARPPSTDSRVRRGID